ncbi:hypothetical protein RRG08_019196 [Elysia crispata]|uniref:Uncharacterized protein n=1 Tax=Elysia crispata TaxID=231223 RepID=A0AAE1ATK9_9GAST|nr:hypothetical protein RRG08_019196 [Elysia crispata]
MSDNRQMYSHRLRIVSKKQADSRTEKDRAREKKQTEQTKNKKEESKRNRYGAGELKEGPAASVSRLNGIRGTSFGDQWALPLPSNQLPGEWRLLELASKTKQPVVESFTAARTLCLTIDSHQHRHQARETVLQAGEADLATLDGVCDIICTETWPVRQHLARETVLPAGEADLATLDGVCDIICTDTWPVRQYFRPGKRTERHLMEYVTSSAQKPGP